jgi:hypothetical protein
MRASYRPFLEFVVHLYSQSYQYDIHSEVHLCFGMLFALPVVSNNLCDAIGVVIPLVKQSLITQFTGNGLIGCGSSAL